MGLTLHLGGFRFDPSLVSYAELVEFNFRMHLPTEVDRQGPDRGTQYRTAIFTTDDTQDEIAKKVRAEVQEAHYPNDKIATTVSLTAKWRARSLASSLLEPQAARQDAVG